MNGKKIVFFIIILASFLVINNLVRSIYTLWQKQYLVDNMRLEVEQKKKENQELQKKLDFTKRPQFVEEEARNKLFMGKPGEGIIVLSQKDLEGTMSAKPKPVDTRPNWKKWWDMFF
jgi:cell division protein FtsB